MSDELDDVASTQRFAALLPESAAWLLRPGPHTLSSSVVVRVRPQHEDFVSVELPAGPVLVVILEPLDDGGGALADIDLAWPLGTAFWSEDRPYDCGTVIRVGPGDDGLTIVASTREGAFCPICSSPVAFSMTVRPADITTVVTALAALPCDPRDQRLGTVGSEFWAGPLDETGRPVAFTVQKEPLCSHDQPFPARVLDGPLWPRPVRPFVPGAIGQI